MKTKHFYLDGVTLFSHKNMHQHRIKKEALTVVTES